MSSETHHGDSVGSKTGNKVTSPRPELSDSILTRMSALSHLAGSTNTKRPGHHYASSLSSNEEVSKMSDAFETGTKSKFSTLSSDENETGVTTPNFMDSPHKQSPRLNHAAISSITSPLLLADRSLDTDLEHELSIDLSMSSSSRVLSHTNPNSYCLKSPRRQREGAINAVARGESVVSSTSTSATMSKLSSTKSEKPFSTNQKLSSIANLRTQQISKLRSPALHALLQEEGMLPQSNSTGGSGSSSGIGSDSNSSSDIFKSVGSSPFLASPRTAAVSPSTSPQTPKRMSALVEKFDPRIDVNQAGSQSPEQKMMDILDSSVLNINADLKLTFAEIRANLQAKGVKNLAVITTTHFLSERVQDQYHESVKRIRAALGHDTFHILVVGFGPEKFIPSFCSTLCIRNMDMRAADDGQPDSSLPNDYDNSMDISVVSDPQRYVYNIMTAYQVGKVTPVLPKGGVLNCSTYSKSFRVYSKLTAPSTTGSGRQYLAWLVVELSEAPKVLHFEIDSDSCKY